MSVRREENGTVVLEGNCPVEDAEPLLQMLQATPRSALRLDPLQPSAYRGSSRSSWRPGPRWSDPAETLGSNNGSFRPQVSWNRRMADKPLFRT